MMKNQMKGIRNRINQTRQFNEQNTIVVVHIDQILKQKAQMQQEIYQTIILTKNQNNQQLQQGREFYENRIFEIEKDRENLRQEIQKLKNEIVDCNMKLQEQMNINLEKKDDINQQLKQTLFQKQKDLLEQNSKLNQQLQSESNLRRELETKNNDYKNQIQLLENKVKNLELNKYQNIGSSSDDFELKRLRNELQYSQDQNADQVQSLKRAQQKIQNLQDEMNKFQVVKLTLDNKLTEETRIHFNEKEKFRNKISDLEKEIENYKIEQSKHLKIIEQNKQTASDQEKLQQNLQKELRDIRINETEQEGKIRNLTTEITFLNSEIDSLRKGKTENKEQLDKQSKEFQERLKKENDQQKGFQTEKNELLEQLRSKQDELDKEKDKGRAFQTDLEKAQQLFKKTNDEILENLDKERKQRIFQENLREKLVLRIQRNYGRMNLNNNVISPFFNLFREHKDPYSCLNGDNASTQDEVFISQKIKAVDLKLGQKIFELSDMDFADTFTLGDSEQWDCLKSIQSNGEGSHSRVAVIQILKTNRYFAIKDTNKFQCDSNVESLHQFIFPTLIAQFLLKQFNQILKKEKLENFRFQDQYILQSGTKYYYAVGIEKCQTSVIKQNGKLFMGIHKQNQQLINAFQLFSYFRSQKQLMIDNLYTAENIIYDPIIHTADGLFNDEDQGISKIEGILDEAKNNKDIYGAAYLSEINIKL